MHILFLTDNFPPEVNAPASRTFEHCREWVKKGHQVTIITCAPNFPKGVVFKGFQNRLRAKEKVDGIDVIRVWSFISANEGFLLRILDYVSFMVSSFVAGLFVRRVDLIVGTSPQFFTVCSAYLLSVFKRRPWVFELRDIWPESIRAVGAVRYDTILNLFERIELFLYRHAEKIVSVTHSFKRNLIERGIDGRKIEVVTNGVDLSRFSARDKCAGLLNEHGLKDKFIVGYIGTHGLAHGLDAVLDAAKLVANGALSKEIHFILLGDGADRQRLAQRCDKEKLTNVTMIASVPKDQVADYWSLLDVSLIHLKDTELFSTVIPSKIFESMGMGVPIVLGVRGESAEIVSDAECGLIVPPENPGAIAEAIQHLFQCPTYREELGRNALKHAKKYDRSNLASAMLAILEDVQR